MAHLSRSIDGDMSLIDCFRNINTKNNQDWGASEMLRKRL